MVFKKLLAGLGFGGVEVDTVLTPPVSSPGSRLTGHVQLRAKSDVDITNVQLILVATGPSVGEVELGRFPVVQSLRLARGDVQQIPFSVNTPFAAPFTLLYEQRLPGGQVGVRTEVTVADSAAKTDFDPLTLEPTAIHQQVIDALGALGCRFVRNELRPGAAAGLPAPVIQTVTFFAPSLDGQPPGPHIPQITFSFLANPESMTVVASLAQRPQDGDRYVIPHADAERLASDPEGWANQVDEWLIRVLDKLSHVPAGNFMQPAGYGGGSRGRGHGGYGNQGRYSYEGRRSGSGVGGMVAAGVGGAALGFLGGMVLSDMMMPDMPEMPDAAGAAEGMAESAGVEDVAALEDPAAMAGDSFGDFGGFDGGGFEEF